MRARGVRVGRSSGRHHAAHTALRSRREETSGAERRRRRRRLRYTDHRTGRTSMSTPSRVFVPFFIGSLLLTLTWGATLGMINLARLTADWGLGVLPRPSVWAHGYVQVFGFMALFIMGVAYHVLP